jgi:hypothetical protein
MLYDIRVVMVEKRLVNVRVTPEEDGLLTEYAAVTGRTRTEILRELIRSLKVRLARLRAGKGTDE